MINCPECNHPISESAKACPSCGCDVQQILKKKAQEEKKRQQQAEWDAMSPKQKKFWTVIAGLIIIVIIVAIIVAIVNTSTEPNHHDGKCDICNKPATHKTGANEEFCDKCFLDYLEWYYKNN